MIASFAGGGTEDVFDGRDSRRARAVCPPRLWEEGHAYDVEITDYH